MMMLCIVSQEIAFPLVVWRWMMTCGPMEKGPVRWDLEM